MKLTPYEIELNKIIIDPYNPRFVNEKKVSQETIISECNTPQKMDHLTS